MADRPIPFSAPMVRAVLAGTKTQTRRAMRPQPTPWGDGWQLPDYCASPDSAFRHGAPIFKSRFGQPGDLLWVREAWRTVAEADALPPRDLTPAHRIWFESDAPHQPGSGRYRPPMFMPRWASRITLEVTGVRVERLQDISEADAIAEGIEADQQPEDKAPLWRNYATGNTTICPQHSYRTLWESINGAGSWDANPWVWVVEFATQTGGGHE